MNPYLLVIAATLLFFLIIPGIGAFAVRSRWRRFRRQVLSSLAWPVFHPGQRALPDGEFLVCRCYGVLEAVEGNDRLWIQTEHSSVALDIEKTPVFMVPYHGQVDWDSLFMDSMRSLRWENAGVLPEGLGVFIAGPVCYRKGLPVFEGTGKSAPLVIFFDGDPGTVLTRAMWFGRQRNEYWNDVTPVSLLTGCAALMSLALFGFRDPDQVLLGSFSAALSLLPFMPLMPPGFLGFFLYRRMWRIGRTLRARRDLILFRQLLTELSPEGVSAIGNLPGTRPGAYSRMGSFGMRVLETGGVIILLVGIVVNFYLILRLILMLGSL